MGDINSAGDAAETIQVNETTAPGTTLSLLDRIILESKIARDESQRPYARDLVSEFVHQVLDEGMAVGSDVVASIKVRIAQIDEALSRQLNEILHDPEYQKLEASWKGLQYLVSNTET